MSRVETNRGVGRRGPTATPSRRRSTRRRPNGETHDERESGIERKRRSEGRKEARGGGTTKHNHVAKGKTNVTETNMDALLAAVGEDLCAMENTRVAGNRRNKQTEQTHACKNGEGNRWRTTPSSSRYRGVSWHTQTGRWKAQIKVHGKDINLGRHKSEEAAARAYDQAAINARGKEAQLNFPMKEYASEMDALRQLTLPELAAKLRGVEQRLAAQTSKYHGVRRNKRTGKWEAYIRVAGKHLHLGCHASEVEAAQAFDRAAMHELSQESHNHKLVTNFAIEDYVEEIEVLRDTPLEQLAVKLRSKEYVAELKRQKKLHETSSHLSEHTITDGKALPDGALDGHPQAESPTASLKTPEVAPGTPQQTPTSRPIPVGEGMDGHEGDIHYHYEPMHFWMQQAANPYCMYPMGMPHMPVVGSKRSAEEMVSPHAVMQYQGSNHLHCPLPRLV